MEQADISYLCLAKNKTTTKKSVTCDMVPAPPPHSSGFVQVYSLLKL